MGTPEVLISANDLEKGQLPHEKHDQHQVQGRSISRSTYHDRVVGLKLRHRPWLESLHQFMSPNAEGFAINLAKRMSHFDIKVIHFPRSGKPISVIKCSTPEDFEAAFNEDKDRTGTLFIAKGISRAMIEALGTRFALEPEFFANHLAGSELYRMGHRESLLFRAPARTPRLLPDYIRKAPFYTVEFRRPYYIEGGKERVLQLRGTETSTPRGVQIVHQDLPDVFFGEKISVYKRKGSNIGIILTDQLVSDIPPSSHIPSPVNLLDDDAETLSSNDRQHQVSSRRELISWIQRLPPDEAKALFSDHSQLALQPVLKIVENNSVMFLAHTRHIMTRILTRHCDAQFPDSILFFLHISRSLHRYTHEQQRLLRFALDIATLRGGDNIAEQKRDFTSLASDMDGALKALEEDVRFLVGEASIREGKIVGWVSKFAALFLPVSLLATILSISDTGFVRWAVLGGLSVPFVLISVYFMFFWRPTFFNSLSS
ncbi:hypothetical protein K432DRAFT_446981 [Lepidopterella palustris CBS 459.81]|uniref:Uncharacterized protein n=1 Tax=Lepidopterella palustris CBS 459.81 TaxID=1314670 RepID=A0A8E2E0C0_9PEZI|nr:hypothetical protein K432DRAFT_446981 [Lepidopterella palustris CBS 459.81]